MIERALHHYLLFFDFWCLMHRTQIDAALTPRVKCLRLWKFNDNNNVNGDKNALLESDITILTHVHYGELLEEIHMTYLHNV